MIAREEIFQRNEKLWVLCIGRDSLKAPMSASLDLVDWYNNQILARALTAGKIETDFGKTALIATSGLLPVQRLLVFGLGETDDLTASQGKKFAEALDQILEGIGENDPWIVFPESAPPKFIDEVQKSRTSTSRLAHAKIST